MADRSPKTDALVHGLAVAHDSRRPDTKYALGVLRQACTALVSLQNATSPAQLPGRYAHRASVNLGCRSLLREVAALMREVDPE